MNVHLYRIFKDSIHILYKCARNLSASIPKTANKARSSVFSEESETVVFCYDGNPISTMLFAFSISNSSGSISELQLTRLPRSERVKEKEQLVVMTGSFQLNLPR